MKAKMRQRLRSVVEELVFGVEDSLVSTLGALTGVAAGTRSGSVVILTGIVLIFAEALSMAAGSYLSSKSEADVWLTEHANDWQKLMTGAGSGPIRAALHAHRVSDEAERAVLQAVEVQRKRWLGQVIQHERRMSSAGARMPLLGAAVMGVSYLFAGFVPLAAYIVWPVEQAMGPSIGVTVGALFLFGAWKATLTERSAWRSGIEMVTIAMAAAGVAYGLGIAVRTVFGVAVL